ncbi:outer membrane beta-barrel protein [Chitinophaga pinensis]|uniref:Outer membrane beta-barrel protein n=1 Tax=Chitinophaga pinensis TaxID=79329 RepID=A0A5C6LNJ2_9BACT|nr:outer membrane beta-barrel protein [Chitinophaga pinensis]TWV96223.1 outer membrane beta-barrel protein [Chitinophaga pinensis]
MKLKQYTSCTAVKAILKYLLIIWLIVWCVSVKAQQKDSLSVGSISGVTFDSTHNYVLKNTSISVYNASNELLTFSLSNTQGEFSLPKLPLRQKLKLVISYLGYATWTKTLQLEADKPLTDLHYINLLPENTALNEVVVTAPPPVRMNGDTLEFNADAFALDKNAVAEELLIRLPGVVLWSDGSITVNGKTVSRVLVDGKPFFGNEAAIATQNIPKNAIGKIQVYQKTKKDEQASPHDSIPEINIQLKEDKHEGHFGELSAGYGSRRTYESNMNMNFFSPRTQWGLFGIANNVNKTAGGITDLLLNTAFRSLKGDIDNQPDFGKGGLNQSLGAGVFYHHDFKHDGRGPAYLPSEVGADYFLKRDRNNHLTDISSLTTLGTDSAIIQKSKVTVKDNQINHQLNIHQIELRTGKNIELAVKPSLAYTTYDNVTSSHASSLSTKTGLQSVSSVESESHARNTHLGINARYSHDLSNNTSLSMAYSIDYNRDENNRYSKSIFTSFADAGDNQYVERKALNTRADVIHRMDAAWIKLAPLLFGRDNFLSTIHIDVENGLEYSSQSADNVALDNDTTAKHFISDPYLTYHSRYRVINENPAVKLSRTFERTLEDKYTKSLSVYLNLQQQIYIQQNTSSHTFRQFDRNYHRFVPSVSLSYENDQLNRFSNSYHLGFKRSFEYATVDMLYPIVDSTNFYYLMEGNPDLTPAETREFNFRYNHNSSSIEYGLVVTATTTDNFFAGSSYINENGTTITKIINLDGRRNIELRGEVQKPLRLRNGDQLQIAEVLSFARSRNPNYLVRNDEQQDVMNISYGSQLRNKITVYFIHLDRLALNLSQNARYYLSKQRGFNDARVSSYEYNTSLSVGYTPTRRFTISSNITSNSVVSSAADPVTFTIWNLSAAYRLLPGNNLELKFSALDLLGQNRSINNYGNNYVLTQESHNVLRQYFMLTLTYFPRKFGS